MVKYIIFYLYITYYLENDHYDIEVTTSEPVELILNNPEDFINANDCCVIHESSKLVMINYFVSHVY